MRLKQHKKQLLKTRQPRLGACLSVQYDKRTHSVRLQTALQTHKLSNKHVHVKYVQCIHVVYINTYMSYMYNGTCTTIHVHAYTSHSRSWDMEIMTTLGWNVTLGLRPRVTFSTSGSSYFHVPLTTVRHLLNVIHVHEYTSYMYTHTCHIHTRMHVHMSYIYTRLHIVHVHVIYVHMSTDTYTFTWEKHVDFCVELGLQRVAVVEARTITWVETSHKMRSNQQTTAHLIFHWDHTPKLVWYEKSGLRPN